MKNIIKDTYQITELISEDIISYNYQGLNLQNQQVLLIKQYKTEYLTPTLVARLIAATEKLIAFTDPRFFTVLDCHYDGQSFFVINAFSKEFIRLDKFLATAAPLATSQIATLATQLIAAGQATAEKQFIIGSLNLVNIYLDQNLNLKIAHPFLPLEIIKSHVAQVNVLDNLAFFAPEFLQYQKYSTASDVYAFGVILYFLFTQQLPYLEKITISDMKKELIKDFVFPPPHYSHMPEFWRQLIFFCLLKNPQQRISTFTELAQIYAHPDDLQKLSAQYDPALENVVLEALKKDLEKKKQQAFFIRFKTIALILTLFFVFLFMYVMSLKYLNAIPLTVVPDVRNLSQEKAVAVLRDHKLKAILGGEMSHPTVSANFVVDTKPSPLREVKQDRVIKLFISKGQPKIYVSDLKGKSLAQAQVILPEADLVVEQEEYSYVSQKGLILEQTPTPNNFIKSSESVSLVISKGFPVELFFPSLLDSQVPSELKKQQVVISLSVLPTWPVQNIEISYLKDQKITSLYQQSLLPSETVELEYELETGGYLEVYFNGILAARTQVIIK